MTPVRQAAETRALPTGVYINAKFAINSHCSYKKTLAIKSLCIFYISQAKIKVVLRCSTEGSECPLNDPTPEG